MIIRRINGAKKNNKQQEPFGSVFSFGKPCDIIIQPTDSVKKFECDSKEQSDMKEKVTKLLTQPYATSGSASRYSQGFSTSSKQELEHDTPVSGKFCSESSRKGQHDHYGNAACQGFELAMKKVYLGKKIQRTSEELLMDKIAKEKKALMKQKRTNACLYQKSKKYVPLSVNPLPLTLIKPFKLSSTTSVTYLRKRMSRTEDHIEKINNKIKMKVECKSTRQRNNNQ